MSLVPIFVALVLIALAVWAVPKLMGAIGVPANVATVVYVGLVVLIVLYLLSALGFSASTLRIR